MSHPRVITYKGQTRSLTEWARFAGMSPQAFRTRLEHGWTMADALNEPIRRKRTQTPLSVSLPALRSYEREIQTAHHAMRRSYERFSDIMQRQLDLIARQIEADLAAQREHGCRKALEGIAQTPRVGQNVYQSANEHSPSSVQETT